METSNYIFFLFFPIMSMGIYKYVNNQNYKKTERNPIATYEPNLNPSWPLNELEKLI
jgi:hypothetical protein